jgi:hypothetical protein
MLRSQGLSSRRVSLASVVVAAFVLFPVAGTAVAAHHHRHYTVVHATNSWKYGSSSVNTAIQPFVGSGIGKLPQAPSSEAFLEGSMNLSDGTTPALGGALAAFLKGNESYNGSTTTTVVNFTLPSGVTVLQDPSCSFLGNPNNYCILAFPGDPGCVPDSSNIVTVSGNEIEFRLACTPGDSFYWEAELSSLISTPGSYDTSAQFKVGVYRRAKGVNMWQIQMPGSLEAFGP